MSLSTKAKFLVSTVVALGLAGAVSATDREFDGSVDNTWNEADNWTPSGVPADGDTVTIPSGKECHVDINNARADAFVVESGGTLIIDAGMLLEIDSNSSVAQAQGVQLAGSGSELKISGTLTLSGAGSLQGLHNDAVIRVGNTYTFTNTTKLEGQFQLIGDGAFVNGDGGVVEANRANGVLDVNPGMLSADHANAVWRSNNDTARLEFSKGNTSMAGFFDLIDGEIKVEVAMTTTGDLDHADGQLNVEANFKVADYDWDGGTGRLAPSSSLRFEFATYSGTKTNPDNTPDLDPPYEVVNTDPNNQLIWS